MRKIWNSANLKNKRNLSGETVHSNYAPGVSFVPSVSSEYDDDFNFLRKCTTLINTIVTKLDFIVYLLILLKKYVWKQTFRYSSYGFVRSENPCPLLYIYSYGKVIL
jgi:hypothetical protein